ncbi:hypothetical protein [Bacillus sp. X1(2014)]|nr:hypothetical protein [Bacillus sp. X1(2014)]
MPSWIVFEHLEGYFLEDLLYELGKKGAKWQVADKSQKVADKIVKRPIK